MALLSQILYAGRLRAGQSPGAAGKHCGQQTRRDHAGARAGQHSGGKTDYPQAIKLLQTATEDIDSDSAVDAQCCWG
jgi:hypothetical protein